MLTKIYIFHVKWKTFRLKAIANIWETHAANYWLCLEQMVEMEMVYGTKMSMLVANRMHGEM